jgi:hypothetical protein
MENKSIFSIILKSNEGRKGETPILTEYSGNTVKVQGSTEEHRKVQRSTVEIQGSIVKYRGVKWKYRRA